MGLHGRLLIEPPNGAQTQCPENPLNISPAAKVPNEKRIELRNRPSNRHSNESNRIRGRVLFFFSV